jgi:hypothetical protein
VRNRTPILLKKESNGNTISCENWSNSKNSIRHNHDEFDHAHFSHITHWNEDYFPLLANLTYLPLYIIIYIPGGDVLYIPTGWWHWVRTYRRSASINY